MQPFCLKGFKELLALRKGDLMKPAGLVGSLSGMRSSNSSRVACFQDVLGVYRDSDKEGVGDLSRFLTPNEDLAKNVPLWSR
jgi:hypothetical protein